MFDFVDIVETTGYESIATRADVNVETFDVVTCFEGSILRD